MFKDQVKKKYISKEKILSLLLLKSELLNNKKCYCSENSVFIHVKEVPHYPPKSSFTWQNLTKAMCFIHTEQHILEGESRMISSAVDTMALHANI